MSEETQYKSRKGFQDNNELYKLRSSHGRPSKYNSDELKEIANDYFEFCLENPIKGKVRPFTIRGFCVYAEISRSTFLNYEKDSKLSDTCELIRDIIENQQFEHAIIGEFKENIIGRALGMTDKQELTISDESVDFSKYSNEELIARSKAISKIKAGSKSGQQSGHE